MYKCGTQQIDRIWFSVKHRYNFQPARARSVRTVLVDHTVYDVSQHSTERPAHSVVANHGAAHRSFAWQEVYNIDRESVPHSSPVLARMDVRENICSIDNAK